MVLGRVTTHTAQPCTWIFRSNSRRSASQSAVTLWSSCECFWRQLWWIHVNGNDCNSQPYYVLLYLACFEDKSYMDFCWVFEQDQSRMVEESCAFETNLERPTCESIIFQFTIIYPTRSCSNRSLRSANCCWAAAAWTGLRNGQSHSRCHPKILLSKVKVWWALTNINKLYILYLCYTMTYNYQLSTGTGWPGPFKTRECSDVIGSLWTLVQASFQFECDDAEWST